MLPALESRRSVGGWICHGQGKIAPYSLMAGHLLTTADGPLEDLWRADVEHSLTQGALWILVPKPTVRQGLELTVRHGEEPTPPSCRAVIILLLLPAARMPLLGQGTHTPALPFCGDPPLPHQSTYANLLLFPCPSLPPGCELWGDRCCSRGLAVSLAREVLPGER